MRLLRPRLREPVAFAVIMTAIAAVIGVGQGWAAAAVLEAVTVAVGFYLWGGKDTDVGAVIGHRAASGRPACR